MQYTYSAIRHDVSIEGNHTTKSGQLLEYNMKKIFLGKSYTKHSGEASPKPFYKTLELCITFQVQVYQNMLKLRCWPLTFTFYKVFLWNKESSAISLPNLFFVWFSSRCILLTDKMSLSDWLYFLTYWVLCALQSFAVQSVTSEFLKLAIAFFSSHFSTEWKSEDKNLNFWITK